MTTPDALAAMVPDGALLALPPDNSLPSVVLARALVRRGARGLRLLGVPVSGFAPRFTAALRAGAIRVRDATCPAIHTMLQAAEKGVPFMPLRGLIGSDILAHRPDWRVMPNPFGDGASDPIVLLPALQPDVAAIHGVMADEEGNVWVGRRR
ncbi:MAG TPA: CoA transferase, partial [Acetobacteraceae bacterium]|nr:CoA transferase [Acetobacteraceae bacterium]